jgi:hypothetical protein
VKETIFESLSSSESMVGIDYWLVSAC